MDFNEPFVSRRQLLSQLGNGMGMLGLAAALEREALSESPQEDSRQSSAGSLANPLAKKPTHFAPKAKRIIHLWMNGEIGRAHV